MYFFRFLFLLGLIAGCNQNSTIPANISNKSLISTELGAFGNGTLALEDELEYKSTPQSRERHEKLFIKYLDAFFIDPDTYRSTDSLAQKIEKSYQHIEQLSAALKISEPDIPEHVLDQYAASQFIGPLVVSGLIEADTLWTARNLEILSDYTQMLIDNRNPQIQIIEPALRRFIGYWSKERLDSAYEISITAAKAWLQAGESDSLPHLKLNANQSQIIEHSISRLEIIQAL